MVTRVLSSLVLGPVVLLAIYLGPPTSDGLLLAVAAVLAWEWGSVCGRRRGLGAAESALVAACLAAVAAGALFGPGPACAVALLGAGLAGLLAARDRRGDRELALWFGFGVLYVAVPLLALQWLRGPGSLSAPPGPGTLSAGGLALGAGEPGEWRVYWLLGLVWATDVGAFFAGRGLKGPKLWPRISPNKTWAGMVGGLVAAGLTGALFSSLQAPGLLWWMVILSMLLSFVAQAGDFFESGVKRRFGAKDSSGLIPGHGGLLDRVDGLLAATLALAFLAWLGKAPF